jgi:hypothetical protein
VNTTAKQNKAGVTDLNWKFELYHIAWATLFASIWYSLGFIPFLILFVVVAGFFVWKA